MAGKLVAANTAALTANGTAAGVVTVADTTLFPAGSICYLYADTQTSVCVKVIKVTAATTLVVRIVPNPQILIAPTYGNSSDVSAFTTVRNAKLNCEQQVVDEYASYHSL